MCCAVLFGQRGEIYNGINMSHFDCLGRYIHLYKKKRQWSSSCQTIKPEKHPSRASLLLQGLLCFLKRSLS